ncbi:MAG TPA: Hpt domain-containing protein [Polyangiaceae bacterium]|jgi:chemosensory pili system protein ChpA (sensor histidine kinase/response regulator)
MASFSIDDVRDTIRADITRLLARIEETARGFARHPDPPTGESAGEGEAQSFQAIGDCGHAIFGTSALVEAESLASSARCLEKLAARGEEEARLAALHLSRARRLAEVAALGAGEMRQMLELELQRRGDEAQWSSLEWQGRADEALAGLDGAPALDSARAAPDAASPAEVPPAPASQERLSERPGAFAFEDEAAEAAPPAPEERGFDFEEAPAPQGDDELRRELLGVFEREAREVVVALQGHFTALDVEPGSASHLAAVERLFHTLKGAAATIGLEEVRAAASELQHAAEVLVEAGGSPERAAVEALREGANRMLAAAKLPAIAVDAAGGNAPPAVDAAAMQDARAVFLEEARRIHEESTALVREMADDGSSIAAQAQSELAAWFHRLKGSAAVVGDDAIGKEAVALHELAAGSLTTGSVRALREGVARLGALVGGGAPVVRARREEENVRTVRAAVTVPEEPELWKAFNAECGELLDTLERETLDLEHSDTPRERVREILRLYHTLKGVVNTMGLAPTGAVLHRAEDFLEETLERAVLPSLRGVVSLLLQVQMQARKNLRQAQNGYVETSLAWVDARAERLLGGSVMEERPGTAASEAGSAADGSNADADHEGRRFIKVATERLDVLMNLAGELVVNRSRLLSKVGTLRTLQTELGRGSKRLVDTIDAFRRENEFANLDGRRAAPAPVPAPPAVLRADGGVPTAAWSGFSDLELDRYDDVHVLSRSLAEITSDFQELYAQFQRGVSTLTDDSDAFGGIISGIQNEVTRARMVPLEVLFARLRLPVRDAATREGKEVRVVTRGADVTIDKTIADALFQPMLHLVRNAVAHGVEKAAGRDQRGKGSTGTITLAARQESGQILLEVRDDGAGLDLEALRARGLEMGLVAADVPLDDPSIKELVFAPQLSTQRDVGTVAGRGVGCDVVRRAIERLNGTIRVETSAGQGTAFVINLPLTLAITKALLVRHRQQTFALPLYFAERIIDAHEQRTVDSAGHRRIKLDDAFVPVRTLGELLAGPGAADNDGPVVVLRVGDQRLTLQVDQVVGQEEIVVKSLGTLLAGHPLFAGVSIRGTGELVLIVDVPELVDARGIAAPSPARPARPARPSRSRAPAAKASAASEAPSEDLASPPAAPSASERGRLRVLFVDDSLSVRKVAEMNLKALGVDVTLAVDGLDAMAKLREQTFDLVFTDLEMPRMHGYELIRELRFLPAYADLPILVVTSRSGQKHQDQARALGATEYMTKPFTPQSLEAAIKRWGQIRSDKSGAGSQGAS